MSSTSPDVGARRRRSSTIGLSRGDDRDDGVAKGWFFGAHPGLSRFEVPCVVGKGGASKDAGLLPRASADGQRQLEPACLLDGDDVGACRESTEEGPVDRHPEVKPGGGYLGRDDGNERFESATGRLCGLAPRTRTVPVTRPVIGLIWARAEATPWGKVTSVWKPEMENSRLGAGAATGAIVAVALRWSTIGVSTGSGQ